MSVTNVPLYVANGTDYNWRHSLTYGVQGSPSTTYLASRHHGYCECTHNRVCILLECSAISKVQVITPPPHSILPRHMSPSTLQYYGTNPIHLLYITKAHIPQYYTHTMCYDTKAYVLQYCTHTLHYYDIKAYTVFPYIPQCVCILHVLWY